MARPQRRRTLVPSSSHSPAAAQSTFLSEIHLEHGPISRLGHFFLKADNAARDRGISLAFGTPEEFAQVNEQNRDSWRPLIPIFHPRMGNFSTGNGFCILGRNRNGTVVATQAARFYPLDQTTFYDAASDLSLYYPDASAARARGESCLVTAQATRNVSGRVVFSGGGWYHPDYRGRFLSCILPRISRAYAFSRWNSDFTVSMMAEGVIKGGMAERCGYTNIDWDVSIRNFAIGDLRFAFVWMEAAQLLTDLEQFLSSFDAEVDRTVDQGRAKQNVVP